MACTSWPRATGAAVSTGPLFTPTYQHLCRAAGRDGTDGTRLTYARRSRDGGGPMSDDASSRFNQVQLVGRLAADAVHRELPSGDRMATFRLVIDRPDGSVEPRVDTIDCAVWRADLRRRLGGWRAGDVLRVEGELRRRFWRAGAGVA